MFPHDFSSKFPPIFPDVPEFKVLSRMMMIVYENEMVLATSDRAFYLLLLGYRTVNS